MSQVKDFLMIVSLVVTAYAGFNKANSLAYWISGALFLGFICVSLFPRARIWFSGRKKKSEMASDEKRIASLLVGLKHLFLEYRSIIGEPNGNYSDTFSYIARDSSLNKELSLIVYNSFYHQYLANLIGQIDNYKNAKATMIEMAKGFGEINKFICDNWKRIDATKREGEWGKQFLQLYNEKVGQVEIFLKRVLPFSGEGTDPNSYSNYHFARRFERLT